MQRLTFRKPDGTYGVAGMNEQNQEQVLYVCVKKLLHYEETGLSPDEVENIKQQLAEKAKEIENIKSKICEKCRKCIQKRYVDCAFQNFDNEYCGNLDEIINSYLKYQKNDFAIEQADKDKIKALKERAKND